MWVLLEAPHGMDRFEGYFPAAGTPRMRFIPQPLDPFGNPALQRERCEKCV